MINKIAKMAINTVARKTGNAVIQKAIWSYEKLDKEWSGGRPVNIGEDASMRCYRAMPNDSSGFCRNVFDYEIRKYHNTGKYK